MKIVTFFVLFFLLAGPLAAENDSSSSTKDSWYKGFYVGAGAAFLRIETRLSNNGLAPAESIESDRFNKTSIASKYFLGYRIIPYAGIEVGYFKAYDVEQSYCFTDMNGDCTESRGGPGSVISSSAWKVKLPTEGYTVAATGFWPINDTLELMIKVGGVKPEIDALASESVVGGLIPVKPPAVPPANPPVPKTSISDSWDAMGAFGVNFNSENGISVRAEIEYFNIKEIDEPWLVSLNALYNF